jgi:hypothetical protein
MSDLIDSPARGGPSPNPQSSPLVSRVNCRPRMPGLADLSNRILARSFLYATGSEKHDHA